LNGDPRHPEFMSSKPVNNTPEFLEFDEHAMFGPGGTDLSPIVLREMYRPYVNPWSDQLVECYEETLVLLKRLYNTRNDMVITIGPIRSAMDTVMCSIAEPGDHVMVCSNGYWSEMFMEILRAHGADPIACNGPWGLPMDPQRVSDELARRNDIKAVVLTHVETSTGVINPVKEIGQIVKSRGLPFVLDCAQSIGGMPIMTDEWQVDFVLGGTHKCMSAPAGLGFIGISPEGWRVVERRKTPINGWYSNLLVWRDTWMERNRNWYTFPSSSLFGLRAVLDYIFKLGPEEIYKRYRLAAKAIRWGASEMGLGLYVDGTHCPGCDSEKKFCADTATPIVYPAGVTHKTFAGMMARKYNIAIGGGLGERSATYFRVGPTGIVQIVPANVLKLMTAIGVSMNECGANVNLEAGLNVAARILDEVEPLR